MTDEDTNPSPCSPDEGIQTRFSAEESTSRATLRALAAFTGKRPEDIEPLYEAVDPEAIDTLFETPGISTANVVLSFDHEGCEVVVQEDGTIIVLDREPPD